MPPGGCVKLTVGADGRLVIIEKLTGRIPWAVNQPGIRKRFLMLYYFPYIAASLFFLSFWFKVGVKRFHFLTTLGIW